MCVSVCWRVSVCMRMGCVWGNVGGPCGRSVRLRVRQCECALSHSVIHSTDVLKSTTRPFQGDGNAAVKTNPCPCDLKEGQAVTHLKCVSELGVSKSKAGGVRGGEVRARPRRVGLAARTLGRLSGGRRRPGARFPGPGQRHRLRGVNREDLCRRGLNWKGARRWDVF